MKKRRELTELNESTKQLRNQVKAKKQNIATLEELLKETNKAREKEFHNFKNKMVSNEEKPVQSRLMSTIINFFVTSATGLCIEFNERLDTIASDLIVKVKKVLDTKQNQQRPHNTKDFSINIIFRGKILMSEQTLFSAGINDGDTLLAVVEKEVEEVKEKEKPVETNVKQKEMELKEMLQFLSTQQESMREFAKDIK